MRAAGYLVSFFRMISFLGAIILLYKSQNGVYPASVGDDNLNMYILEYIYIYIYIPRGISRGFPYHIPNRKIYAYMRGPWANAGIVWGTWTWGCY